MAKTKGKKESSEQKVVVTEVESPVEEPPVPPPNSIRIHAASYEHIKTTYPVADLTIKFEMNGTLLFESPKTQVLRFDLMETDFDFIIPCDLSLPADREKLITTPIIVTVTETERIIDMTEVEILAPGVTDSKQKSDEKPTPSVSQKSKSETSDKKGKKDKGKKGKGSEKGSKASSAVTASAVTLPPKPTGPIELGKAKLDLLPLFIGYTDFSEALYIEQTPPVFDETATAIENLLNVKVNVSLEGPPLSIDASTVLYLTVESIYNVPNLVATDFQYELCCLLPKESQKLEPMMFNKGRLITENRQFKYKIWPRIREEDLPIPSTYRIPDDFDECKNLLEIDIEAEVAKVSPRIEWNIIKRNYLSLNHLANFHHQIGKYRKIPFEIYITPVKEGDDQPGDSKKSGGKAKGDKGSKGKGSSKTPSQAPGVQTEYDATVDYLHLMSIIDLGYLLYPGVSKCRLACPVRTYQEVEVLDETGLEDSYFRPRPPPAPPVVIAPPKGGKGKGGGSAKGKDSKGKGSKGKGSKGSTKGKDKEAVEGKDLSEFLPSAAPPPPPPSKQVFNDEGQPAFIIVEFELFKPLSPKRQLEDLDEDMAKFLAKKPELPKKFISSKVAEDIYSETIRSLLTDMNLQHKSFIEERKNCRCDLDSFQQYLQQTGAYQTYLSTILRSLSMLVPQKYGYQKSLFASNSEFQIFVSDIYVDIIRDMNRVINEQQLLCASVDDHKHHVPNDKLLLFAKEAMELGEEACAERYFMERICCREEEANVWFDYAVFHLELNDVDKATECVTEAVQLDIVHKYGLMMYGLMLLDKNMTLESETCLLRMVCLNPCWTEGWIVLYSFYKQTENMEGAEYCWDQAKKYCNVKKRDDYISRMSDLAWSGEKLKGDVFLKTAGLLIKLRLYQHAENIMSYSLFTQKGLCKYLHGVIAYLKKDYEKALDFLETAQKLIGLDYGVCSLMGHCHIKLYNFEEALKYYDPVLEMFDRPDDIHMVFMNAAMAYDVMGNSQKARQLSLMACKYSPTPQTWLFAGGFYFKQNDLLSAEECLIQSNLCDNRLAEPWAYLALVNYSLKRLHQYDLCITQAKKFNVGNKDLIDRIEKAVLSQQENGL